MGLVRRNSSRPVDYNRWQGRPVLGALVNVAVFVIPIALSIAAATITAHLLPRPQGNWWLAGWWALVLAVPAAVLLATDRLARRALPLAVLLKMTMVFPDQAPKRIAVARKAGSTRDLARRVEEARSHGVGDEPVVAAEKILGLAAALNAHDRLTRGHGERVRAFTDLIADELDLPTADRDRLRWSALLHDIGKLAVHPAILNKPGKLDAQEWEVIKNHPVEGAKLTAPLAGWLGQWANTIVEHHEKFDGTGYPYGLAGDQISLGGRIVAVADCYDTMTAVRTYKPTMKPEAARAELAACTGTHFDPHVVRAFLDVSLARLRPVAGPLAWLGSLPFVSSIPQLGQAASVLGQVGVASVVVAGAAAAGALPATTTTTVFNPDPPLLSIATGHRIAAGAPPSSSRQGAGPVSGTAQPTGQGAGSAGSVTTGSGSVGSSSGSGGPGSGGPASSGPGSSTTTTGPSSTMLGTSTTSVPPPTATSLTGSVTIINGGSQPGRPEQGDQIIVTYSPAPTLSAFCSAWNSASFPDLASPNVQVKIAQPPAGNGSVTAVTDSSDCATGFHFGTIDLGQTGYVSAVATFGGGVAGQCSGSVSVGCTRIHWDGHNTLTITLGRENKGQPTQTAPSVAVYTPDPALGFSGTITSVNEEHF